MTTAKPHPASPEARHELVLGVVGGSGQTEIRDQHSFHAFREKNVARFDVAMNEPLIVSCGETLCGL